MYGRLGQAGGGLAIVYSHTVDALSGFASCSSSETGAGFASFNHHFGGCRSSVPT